jgi:hypothetical protein
MYLGGVGGGYTKGKKRERAKKVKRKVIAIMRRLVHFGSRLKISEVHRL